MQFYRISYPGLQEPHFECTSPDALDMARACLPYTTLENILVELVNVTKENIALGLSCEVFELQIVKTFKLVKKASNYYLVTP